MPKFPETVQRFFAEGDDKMPSYAGTVEEEDRYSGKESYYTDGHPHVKRFWLATYKLERISEVKVDSSEERATWKERNDR